MEESADRPTEEMSEEELMTIVGAEIDRAKDFTLGLIGKERVTAYDYYYGRKFGNEVEGRSQIISHDVAQQIDSALPQLIKFFAGSEKAVEFTARKAEDVTPAEQATEVCNYVFYTQNTGFLLLHDAIKNALLQKTACFKWYWDTSVRVEEETYRGVSEDLIAMLHMDKSLEIVAQSPSEQSGAGPQGEPLPLYDVTVKTKKGAGRVKICVVPPDELLVADNAYGMDADEIPCMTHRTRKTLSKLVEMGYSEEEVLTLVSEDSTQNSYEAQARSERTGEWRSGKRETHDPMMREVDYDETYILVDFDRDGIAERRKVCSVGGKMLHNEVIGSVPLSFGTTKIMPHEFYGVSMADEVMDLQLRKSTLLRLGNDSLMLAVTPRIGVDTNKVTNLDDVMTVRMGGAIRSQGDVTGAVVPITIPYVGHQVFPMIEYIDSEEETRTGVSRLMQGVDPNTLNKTATGVNALMNAAQARIELVARGLAETLIKPMFRGIMKLLSEHPEEAKNLTIRLRNEYVPLDPRVWETEYDMTVNVGLGTGTKDQQMAHLSNLMGIQAQMFTGPFGQMFPPQEIYTKIYNAAAKLAETAGFKDPNQFFPDPKMLQAPPPQKPPELQKAEMQIAANKEEHAAEMQAEAQKQQVEHMFKEREMAFEQRMQEREFAFEARLKEWEAGVNAQIRERQAVIQASQPRPTNDAR